MFTENSISWHIVGAQHICVKWIFFIFEVELVTQLVKNQPAIQETLFDSWVGKISWRRDRLPTPAFLGFPGGSDGKESAFSVGDLDLIPGWEDPLEGMATHSSILFWRIPTDGVAWWAAVHGVAESDTTK